MNKLLVQVARHLTEAFPRLAMTYRYSRDSRKICQEPQQTPMGFMLVGNESMQKGEFEPQETQLATAIFPHVDVVINIGANIGYYCCLALGEGKHVVAFEPMDLNLRYLLRNIEINNWASRAEVFPLALSDKPGVIEMYGGGTGASLLKGWAGTSEKYVTLVPCSTLDNVLGSRFSGKRCFIIVDIEGAERMMLEGASSVVTREPKPVWMMEISICEHQPEGIGINPHLFSTFDVFWKQGYEAVTADKQCRLVGPDEIINIARSGVNTLQTHNFLFVEKGRVSELLNIWKVTQHAE